MCAMHYKGTCYKSKFDLKRSKKPSFFPHDFCLSKVFSKTVPGFFFGTERSRTVYYCSDVGIAASSQGSWCFHSSASWSLGYVHAYYNPTNPTNGAQPHDDRSYILPHVNFYLLMRHEWTYGYWHQIPHFHQKKILTDQDFVGKIDPNLPFV